jgi:molybdopterin-guanine dinucleotide biosynthesis protein A
VAARGCVLAGGAGRRLGVAKAGAPLRGRPLVSYPLAALAAAGLRPAIVAKPATALPELGAEVWREPPEPAHPLCGVVEALRRADTDGILVCPCDMPFVTPDLARWLADLPDPLAVVASQPLLGRYSAGLVEPLAAALASGRSMRAATAALGARLVAADELRLFGDPDLLIANVNTRADLARAERLIGERAERAE